MRTWLWSAWAFSANIVRILTRDRVALFFTLVLPVIVITIVGSTFGGTPRFRIGLVVSDRGPLAAEIARAIERADGIRVQRFAGADALRRAVRRFSVDGGLIVPAGFDAAVSGGRGASLGWIANEGTQAALSARLAVSGTLDPLATSLGVAQLAVRETRVTFARGRALAAAAAGSPVLPVSLVDVSRPRAVALSRFSLVAPQNLVLFTFISSLAAGAALVRARRLGILRRTLATRTGTSAIVAGVGAGRYVFALFQSVSIVAIGSLLFGVRWGDPAAAIVLVLVFALVGCAAGLLVGALGENEDRVSALTPIVGIVIGALGGCMVPLEVFPPAMRWLAHATPHYWAVTAWQRLVFDGDGLGAILPSLGALLGFALAGIVLATAVLRRRLVLG